MAIDLKRTASALRHVFTTRWADLNRNEKGMTLVAGIMMLLYFTMFGAVMMSQMITDANNSTANVVATRTYYLADAGIQWGRKYIANVNITSNDTNNVPNTTLGPYTFAGGSLTVTVTNATIAVGGWAGGNNVTTYRILSTATLGNTTRVIEEFRYKTNQWNNALNRRFVLYREVVAN